MRNLPKPTHLEIGIDEWQVAQGNIEGVDVTVQWRGVREDPALVDLLAALPPAEPFVPITLVDGRTELAPQRWKSLRFGSGRSFFEAAQRDFEPWGKVWSSPSPLAKARRNVTNMIRRHVPNFDDYTDKEQIDFIVRTQDKVNKIRESVEALILHLEYAAPDKPNAVPPHQAPRADVRAAVFSAVMGGTRRAGRGRDPRRCRTGTA